MDIKKILGDSYKEDMTAEEVISALEKSTELKTADSLEKEIEKMKVLVSKANAEAAESKRLLKEKMSAEELKAKEESEEIARLKEERDNALRDLTQSSYEKEFLSLGYEKQLASDTAMAMVKGEMQTVFKNMKGHLEKVAQDIKAESIKSTPRMDGTGTHSSTLTQEQFDNLTYAERIELKNSDPEQFKQLNES